MPLQAVGIDAVDRVHVDLSPLRSRELTSLATEIDGVAADFGASRVEQPDTADDPLQVHTAT